VEVWLILLVCKLPRDMIGVVITGKWTPFKELLHVVSAAVIERQPSAYYELDAQLTKNKPNLVALLQHAVRN